MPDDLSRRGFMGFLGAAAGSLGLSKLCGKEGPEQLSELLVDKQRPTSKSTTEDWSPPFHVDEGDELDGERLRFSDLCDYAASSSEDDELMETSSSSNAEDDDD